MSYSDKVNNNKRGKWKITKSQVGGKGQNESDILSKTREKT